MEVLDQRAWNFAMKTELEVKETHMANILTVAEASTKSHVFVNGWLRPIWQEKIMILVRNACLRNMLWQY